jgi:hypothetical protein
MAGRSMGKASGPGSSSIRFDISRSACAQRDVESASSKHFQTHGAVVLGNGHGSINRCFTGSNRHVGCVGDDGGTLHQLTAGTGVIKLGELGKDFHHLIGTLTAGSNDTRSASACFERACCNTVFPEPKGPGIKPVPPSAMG